MPRTSSVPAYRLHKPSCLAASQSTADTSTLASKARYARLIAKRASSPQSAAPSPNGSPLPSQATIGDMLAPYSVYAEEHYDQYRKRSSEFHNMQFARRPLRLLYGETMAAEFGPKQLKPVRQQFTCDRRYGERACAGTCLASACAACIVHKRVSF